MIETATASQPHRLGPAPALFLITQKSLENAAFVLKHPAVYEQLRALLSTAENDFFIPLLMETKPTEFTQQFEFLANKYFPIRLQALITLATAVGVDEFRKLYFDRIPSFVGDISLNANTWGLHPSEVAESFEQYFSSARQILVLAPDLPLAPPAPILRLLTTITEVDFGYTALWLVFEQSVSPARWAVHEVFKLTRRALLVYQEATNALLKSLKSVHSEQDEIDFDAAYHAAVVDITTYRREPDVPPDSDRRSTFRTYASVERSNAK